MAKFSLIVSLILGFQVSAWAEGSNIQLPQGYQSEVEFLDNATPDEIAQVYGTPGNSNVELTQFYLEHPALLVKSDKGTPLEIHVSRAKKTMTVSLNGSVIYNWFVTVGLPGLGTTKPFKGHPYGVEYRHPDRQFRGAVLPYVIKVIGGEFIHGTQANYYLGKAHSHGCVRLAMNNAQTLYNLVGTYGLKGTWIEIK